MTELYTEISWARETAKTLVMDTMHHSSTKRMERDSAAAMLDAMAVEAELCARFHCDLCSSGRKPILVRADFRHIGKYFCDSQLEHERAAELRRMVQEVRDGKHRDVDS